MRGRKFAVLDKSFRSHRLLATTEVFPQGYVSSRICFLKDMFPQGYVSSRILVRMRPFVLSEP